MDPKATFGLIDAIDWADVDVGLIFAADTGVVDHIGHLSCLVRTVPRQNGELRTYRCCRVIDSYSCFSKSVGNPTYFAFVFADIAYGKNAWKPRFHIRFDGNSEAVDTKTPRSHGTEIRVETKRHHELIEAQF